MEVVGGLGIRGFFGVGVNFQVYRTDIMQLQILLLFQKACFSQ